MDVKDTIANRVAADLIISIVDPQIRHGHKTTSDKVDGYKSHITVQNVGSTEARLITAVVVTPANTADGEVLNDLMQERMSLTTKTPSKVMGNTTYGSESVRKSVIQVPPETKVIAPVPPSYNRKVLFSKADFQIDIEQQTVSCPAGHTVSYKTKTPQA